MKYKLLSLDLDGTLLSPKLKRINKYDCLAIQKFLNNGGLLLINTGRPPWRVKRVLEKINKYGPNKIKLVSNFNGAYVTDDIDNQTYKYLINNNLCAEVINFVKNFKKVSIFLYPNNANEKKIYWYSKNFFISMCLHLTPHSFRIKEKYNFESFKIVLFSYSKKQINEIFHRTHYLSKNLTICFTSPKIIEITPINIDKAHSIKLLSEKYNIKKNEIFVIGDSFNDIPAFNESGSYICFKFKHKLNINNHINQIKRSKNSISNIIYNVLFNDGKNNG